MADELAERTTQSGGSAGEGAAPTPEALGSRASGADLSAPSLYFNRELSWLDFNDRVLQLAEDPEQPLLERVKFASIWESNLDEVFMVRVANIQDLVEAGSQVRGADGMTPPEVLAALRKRVVAQRERVGRCFARDL